MNKAKPTRPTMPPSHKWEGYYEILDAFSTNPMISIKTHQDEFRRRLLQKYGQRNSVEAQHRLAPAGE